MFDETKPCRWQGGNDFLECRVCKIEYDYRKHPEPPCGATNRIAELDAELATTKRVIAWANNSLFGSHSYFLSLNGGAVDEHILDTAIENLKDDARKLTTVTAQRDLAELKRANTEHECLAEVAALQSSLTTLTTQRDAAVEAAYREGLSLGFSLGATGHNTYDSDKSWSESRARSVLASIAEKDAQG